MDQKAFDTFWYWINERHRIYLKRERGEPKPWTEDDTLQHWKFCNPFRNNDKQTRHLQLTMKFHFEEPELLLFNIYAFRAFNWFPTYELLGGWQDSWDEAEAVAKLQHLVTVSKKQLTSGAYMIRGMEGQPKWQSIPHVLSQVWRDKEELVKIIQQEAPPSMETTYELLRERSYYGWGPFTTYQIVLDLLETPLLWTVNDLNAWCEFGPGAKRGLACIWPYIRNSEMLSKTEFLLKESRHHLEPHVPMMTLQDIEFSLCELSKYIRIKNGGHGKETYAGT